MTMTTLGTDLSTREAFFKCTERGIAGGEYRGGSWETPLIHSKLKLHMVDSFRIIFPSSTANSEAEQNPPYS